MTDRTPEPIGPLVGPYSCVHVVRKKCWKCGIEWDGKAFTAQPEGAAPLPGMCTPCIEQEEVLVKQATQKVTEAGVPIENLQPPRRTFGYED